MSIDREKLLALTHNKMSPELQPLLENQNRRLRFSLRSKAKSCLSSNLCLPSKAATILLLWTAILSYTEALLLTLATLETASIPHVYKSYDVYTNVVVYTILAVIIISYSLWGFLADFCCGRFKVVLTSLSLFTVAVALACSIALSLIGKDLGRSFKFGDFFKIDSVAIFIQLVIGFILFVFGFSGYEANFIQLGLDQLHEAQSEYLGLFAHYTMLGSSIGALISTVLMINTSQFYINTYNVKLKNLVMDTVLFALATGALVLLIITCCKRRWFYVELPQKNPYKTVYKVLQFARRHKYPLQRSAFTYCDDYLPSRIDFAKERYGGPFSTEEVENVKTLFRIIIILISLGPVFALQVPASRYIFPLFGYHTHLLKGPNTHWIRLVDNRLLMLLTENILFSFYIWYIFSHLRKRIPKMLVRLTAGIIFSLLGVISMLITDAVGHSVVSKNTSTNATVQCMFQVSTLNYTKDHQPLNMHWYVLIPPSVFLGIGPLVVIATTIEFISAQSPHSMKSLLIGVFFAIQGFSRLTGYLITLPFSASNYWTDKSGISCGSAYLLIISIVGLVGLISFSVAAMRYKYRKRDDENFRQRDVEEVYTRYLSQRAEDQNDYTDS